MSGELITGIGIAIVAAVAVVGMIYIIASLKAKKRLNKKLTEEYGKKRN